jgi:uncharacterized protein YndB with AHSA1/START domain
VSSPAGKTGSKSLQLRTLVSATPEAVWNAFTDPVHLVRWFPLQASIVPGVGGSLGLFWADTGSFWAISAWHPRELLEVEELLAFASKNEEIGVGEVRDSSSGWRISIEEVSPLQTLVAVEHFGLDASPNIRSSVARGWEFELLSLRYYLERQFGKDRSTVWVKKNVACKAGGEAEIWESLVGNRAALPAWVRVKDIGIAESPWQFAATVAPPGSGLFRAKLERLDQDEIEVNLWLATYESLPGGPRDVQADFERRVNELKVEKTAEDEFACRGAR